MWERNSQERKAIDRLWYLRWATGEHEGLWAESNKYLAFNDGVADFTAYLLGNKNASRLGDDPETRAQQVGSSDPGDGGKYPAVVTQFLIDFYDSTNECVTLEAYDADSVMQDLLYRLSENVEVLGPDHNVRAIKEFIQMHLQDPETSMDEREHTWELALRYGIVVGEPRY